MAPTRARSCPAKRKSPFFPLTSSSRAATSTPASRRWTASNPARTAAGRVRRAGGRQPAVRGTRPTRGFARGHHGRRQGGLPARHPLADPNDWPHRPQRKRQSTNVRRPHHWSNAIDETNRRRAIQTAYNEAHGITPRTILKSREAILGQNSIADSKVKKMYVEPDEIRIAADPLVRYMGKGELQILVIETQRKMEAAAKDLDFLEAARYRDDLVQLKAEKVAGQ